MIITDNVLYYKTVARKSLTVVKLLRSSGLLRKDFILKL